MTWDNVMGLFRRKAAANDASSQAKKWNRWFFAGRNKKTNTSNGGMEVSSWNGVQERLGSCVVVVITRLTYSSSSPLPSYGVVVAPNSSTDALLTYWVTHVRACCRAAAKSWCPDKLLRRRTKAVQPDVGECQATRCYQLHVVSHIF